MKKGFLIFSAALLAFACSKKEEQVSLNGVYKMDSQSIYAVSNDSLLQTGENHNQIKIYSDSHYIWINMAADSSANFGIGSYTSKGSDVVESNIFNSAGDEATANFNLKIEQSASGYVQKIPSMKNNGIDIKIEEKYTRMKEEAASEYDGLWKATSNYFVKGADTTRQNYPDYKMYNKGNFTWAIRALMDTAKKVYVNYVGAGTFTVDKDKVKEITTLCNIAGGVPETNLTIQNKTADQFTQVINSPDGRVRYTVYSKVK